MAATKRDKSTELSSNFKDRADSAAFFEAWVGAVIARAGLWTLHHPFTVAESGRDIPAYAETWDLDVSDEPPDNYWWSVSVEVKSSNLTFNNVLDYPFTEMMVCSQASWDRKWTADTTQRDFLFVSRQTGAILWLPRFTPVSMNHPVVDETRNQLYKVVKANSEHLMPLDAFVKMVKTNG